VILPGHQVLCWCSFGNGQSEQERTRLRIGGTRERLYKMLVLDLGINQEGLELMKSELGLQAKARKRLPLGDCYELD